MTDSEPPWRNWSPWFRGFVLWLVYLAIALAGSWPLCLAPTSTISIGFEGEATVPLLNVWTLWWNADRLAAAYSGYWNAPIFYPAEGTFAFSEAQPTMAIAGPIIWLTGSRVLAYNIYFWLVLSLNGWASQCLLRRLGHCDWVAFCGGVMCQMLPFVWWQSGVVQLMTLFGIVWTVQALLDLFHIGRDAVEPTAGQTNWRHAILGGLRLGGAFCLTYLLCNYWGMFLMLVLVPSSLWLWNRSALRLQFWLQLALAAIVAAAVLGPWVMVQKSLAARHQWNREQSLIRDLSAYPRDFLDTPLTVPARHLSAEATEEIEFVPPNAGTAENVGGSERPVNGPIAWSLIPQFDFPDENRRDLWPLGPGTAKLFLVPFGLVGALLAQGRRRWGLFAATFGAVAFGLSLGPTVRIEPWVPVVGEANPYELLQRFVPGFALIRSPFRFALFVQLAAVWLSIEALDLLNPQRWRQRGSSSTDGHSADGTAPRQVEVTEVSATHPALNSPPPAKAWQRLACGWWAPLVVFSALLMFEVWPPQQSLFTCPSTREAPAWVLWLRDHSDKGDAVICLPFPTGYTVGDYQETAVWMYWGTMHRRPLVNGYSGFFPKAFVDLKELLAQYHRDQNDPGSPPQLKRYPWDSPGLKGVNDSGARFVVVKRSFATRDDVWQHTVTKFRWAWVTGDEQHQLDVYEILPAVED